MNLRLEIVDGTFAVCKLDPDEVVPAWGSMGSFWTVTKTPAEISIVVQQEHVPVGVLAERDWALLKVAGSLDFALTGILASLANPLAEAGISIFAVSTFDTDYLLVKKEKLEQATTVLKQAGFSI